MVQSIVNGELYGEIKRLEKVHNNIIAKFDDDNTCLRKE